MEKPMSLTKSRLTIRRVTGRVGAELTGVQLSGGLEKELVAEIRAALVTHKVVFFPGQHDLDDENQASFASLLGTLTTAHPTMASTDANAQILELDYSRRDPANTWHTDVTFVDQPPAFSVLRAVELPEYGGDTMWANTAAAYQSMPQELRDLADKLWALHTNEFDYDRRGITKDGVNEQSASHASAFEAIRFEAVHPVVRVHPESGERALLLGQFVKHFPGFTAADSSALFAMFQRHVSSPENTVRWRWSLGDVAIWDNRATQHYAVGDFGSQRRVMRRVTIAGSRPVSVTGEFSRQRVGDTSGYCKEAA
jgi:alpha-ketoglutarate-dependent sulfate ester dioxygenase